MISLIQALHCGYAVKLLLTPPKTASNWRILRKVTDDITSESDSSAVVVYEGSTKSLVDDTGLTNNQVHYYYVYYFVSGSWVFGDKAPATPTTAYEDYSTDVLGLIRDRMDLGLQEEVKRGTFGANVKYIQVLTAPPSLEGQLQFPVLTVHLQSANRMHSALGEEIEPDELEDADWVEVTGYYEHVTIELIAWSLNPDERLILRRAIRRILVANFELFDQHGMVHIDIQQQDIDSVSGEYSVPVYQAMSNVSCEAPVRVGGRRQAVNTINPVLVED